jgi:hypothetical protein
MYNPGDEPIDFPPYGFMFLDERANLGLRVPLDWIPPCGAVAQHALESEWRKWRDAIIVDLNKVLWPSWDPNIGDWIDCPAVETMEPLTRADFALFDYMAQTMPARGLQALPNSPVLQPDAYSHREMFIIEDDRPLDGSDTIIEFASFYQMYDKDLPAKTAGEVSPLWFNAVSRKMSKLGHQIKDFLQRPRPNQTAFLLGDFGFFHEEGRTSQTPSMCSNHCLQGLIGVGGVYEDFHARKIPFNQDALKQFAVDIGDRRVMAGLHYPSDNLCSWILVMKLAPLVYRDPSVKNWLWDAIENHSLIYSQIREFAKTEEGYVYRLPLDYLHSLR